MDLIHYWEFIIIIIDGSSFVFHLSWIKIRFQLISFADRHLVLPKGDPTTTSKDWAEIGTSKFGIPSRGMLHKHIEIYKVDIH